MEDGRKGCEQGMVRVCRSLRLPVEGGVNVLK